MAKETPLFSLSRAKILSVLKKYEPLTKEELAKKSGLSRASIYHHLKTLSDKKLIIEKQDITKLGQPIYVTTNKANPLSLKTLKMFETIFPNLFKS